MRKSILKLSTLVAVLATGVSLAACDPPSSPSTVGGDDTIDKPGNTLTMVSVADTIEQMNISGQLQGQDGFVQSTLKQRIAEEFPNADGVELYTADDKGSFLLIKEGDKSKLVAVSSPMTDEVKDLLSSPEEYVLAIADVDQTAVVAETEVEQIKQKINQAIEEYKSLAQRTVDELEISKSVVSDIFKTIPLDKSAQQLFNGATEIMVSTPTDAMLHTAEGDISTENCRMAYAFSKNNDGSISAYVLTLPDVSNMFDNLATDCVIDFVGNFASTNQINLPELSQPIKQLSFEELFNQVFGEDYVFTPFEEAFDKIMDDVYKLIYEHEVLLVDLNSDRFVVYSNCLTKATDTFALGVESYIGDYLQEFCEYFELSNTLEHTSLLDYARGMSGFVDDEINDEAFTLEKLEELKTKIENLQKIANETGFADFKPLSSLFNTETNINISDYAEHYIPADATPIACYVGSMGARTLDNRFGTGYTQNFNIAVIYKTNEVVVYRDFTVIVPWYTNSTTQSSYALGLGEEGKDYIFGRDETILIEDPILTGEISGVQINPELEKNQV